MFRAVPDHYYSGGFILLNEATICSIEHVITNEKKLKGMICWKVVTNNGVWIIKDSRRLEELMPRPSNLYPK